MKKIKNKKKKQKVQKNAWKDQKFFYYKNEKYMEKVYKTKKYLNYIFDFYIPKNDKKYKVVIKDDKNNKKTL